MFDRMLETVVNVSPSEYSRVGYAWLLRFIFRVGYILGWTTYIAVAVARFSVGSLPVLLLIQAILTIVGMLLYSALIERMSASKLLLISSGMTVVSLLGAILFYNTNFGFFAFSLITVGLFIPQISIFLSNYLEDFFTPNEAIRTLPVIESAETIGGIIAGVLLVSLNFSQVGIKFLFLWIILLLIFGAILLFFKPTLPFFLHSLDEETHRMAKSDFNWNGLKKSVREIGNVPFLQVLSLVVLFQWMIFHFIEFQYTRAAEGFLIHDANIADKEDILTHGLGSLHILFHSSALLIEFVVAGRLLKNIGTFGGFLLHAVMTFLGAISMMLGFSFFTAVLTRNNFEMSSIIYKNSYESAYYAFKYGTQRALREFYEGLIYPLATIFATLSILAIEFFFLEKHFSYVAGLLLLFFVLLKAYFSLHLQKRYTDIAMERLSSDLPLEKFHGIEILAQKGHKNSFQALADTLQKCGDDEVLEKKVTEALGLHGDPRSIPLFVSDYFERDEKTQLLRLRGLARLADSLRRKPEHREIRRDVIAFLKCVLLAEGSRRLKLAALNALALYSPNDLLDYINIPDPLLRAEVLSNLWKQKINRLELQKMIEAMAISSQKDDFLTLASLSIKPPMAHFHPLIDSALNSDHEDIKLYAHFALIRLHHYELIEGFLNLLLEGNPVTFSEGIELLETCHLALKRHIAKSVHHDYLLLMLKKNHGSDLKLQKLHQIYDVCEAQDEVKYIQQQVPELLSPATS